MASSMSAAPSLVARREADQLVRQVQGTWLLNRQLASICQINGLKSTGVKAELQQRIVNLIQEAINSNDTLRFQHIKSSIDSVTAARNGASRTPANASNYTLPSPHTSSTYSSPSSHPFVPKNSPSTHAPRDYPTASNGHRYTSSPLYAMGGQLKFQPSPFYRIVSHIGTVRSCEVMTQHRNTVNVTVRLQDNLDLHRCIDDKTYRVMVFCAAENTGSQQIQFPHQSEIKVNGGDVKANLRGLKNKPGSTRPADITAALRLKASYTNNVEFTYALTTKKFYLLVAVCQSTPVPELVSTINNRRRIPKDSVIADLNRKAQDPDVVATSSVLSLKCPLSYMRLDMPCRGLGCKHIQCFDATSYLQLQEQGPQWLCPICNNAAPFDQLAVDEYVKDILQNTPTSLDAVTIEPDGRWLTSNQSEKDSRSKASNGHNTSFSSYEEDDEDALLISEISIVGGRRNEGGNSSQPNIGTPLSNAGPSSTTNAPRGAASTSNKRPAPAVIDLTLSSDEDDDEPIQRPAKRQPNALNGYHGPGTSDLDSLSPF